MEAVWMHFGFFVGLIAMAACFALIEIQIEGPAGWAARLPTWRVRSKVLDWLFPGRPLTGYHLWVLIFILLMAHLPFVFGLPWSWQHEFKALAFILFFWVVEDFLWFVLNPHFGIRRFRPECIQWHQKTWWWIAPRDYWIGASLASVLYYVSQASAPPPPLEVAMAW